MASCESGLPNCMDAAVLVARDTFMSRVEKVAPTSEKGEDNVLGCEEGTGSAGGVDWNGDGDRWLTRRW